MREAPGAAQDGLIGRELGQYRVLEVIGSGGMGVVYRARDRKLERDVALKVLPAGALADEGARKRFRREALALSRLSHPHIASLFDFDTSGEGIDFLVMELVGGPSLDAKVKRGPLPEEQVVRLGAQIVRALVAAHEQGIVHRDLKPANVKLTADGLAKVLDFGLARIAPAVADAATTDTASGALAGTPPYMSPELLLGREVDERADVYAVGMLLFEMATGRRPYGEASGPHLVAKILNEPMPAVRAANPAVSPQLEFVILKAADKNVELRHQTAKELLADLERLAAGHAPPAGNAEPMAMGGRRPRASRLSRLAAFAAAVAALAIAATTALRPREPRIAATRVLARANVTGLETDGTNVYYSDAAEFVGGADALKVVSIAGGPPRTIPLPWKEAVMLRGISREPPALLARVGALDDARLWRVPLGQGSPVRLEGVPGSMQVAWNPQGDRLAVVVRSGDAAALLVGDAMGARAKRLATFEASRSGDAMTFLGWHPSGERIRYLLAGSDHWSDLDAGGGRPLGTPFRVDAETWGAGTWTADGSFFLQGTRRGVVGYRESALLPGSKAPVSVGGPAYTYLLRATPDGRHLVAFAFRPSAEIVRVGADGPAAAPLLAGARAWQVAYSRDGSRVAWASADEWPARLWVSQPGRAPMPLGEVAVDEGGPITWSPDGRWIAFTSVEGRGLPVAYLREGPAGSDVRRRLQLAFLEDATVEPLAPDPEGAAQVDPCWSPDGSWLAYGTEAGPNAYLRRVDLATRRVTKLQGSDGLWSSKCAADGRMVANDYAAQVEFLRPTTSSPDRERHAFLKVRDPGTGDWTRLVVDLPPELPVSVWGLASVNWSHDSRRLYATIRHRTGGLAVVQVDAASGRLEKWTEVSGLGTTFWWLGLDPKETPLVQRDASQREVVVMDLEYR